MNWLQIDLFNHTYNYKLTWLTDESEIQLENQLTCLCHVSNMQYISELTQLPLHYDEENKAHTTQLDRQTQTKT